MSCSVNVVGGKAYDGIGSSHLLAYHERDGDEGSLSVTGDLDHFLHQGFGRRITSELSFVLQLLRHVLKLCTNVVVVGRKTRLKYR